MRSGSASDVGTSYSESSYVSQHVLLSVILPVHHSQTHHLAHG